MTQYPPPSTHKTNRGFTLIELLVVVAIIVLLISMLAPALEKAIAVAQNAECQSNLKNMSQGIYYYLNDTAGRKLPHMYSGTVYTDVVDGVSVVQEANGQGKKWPWMMWDSGYYSSIELTYCPIRPREAIGGNPSHEDNWYGEVSYGYSDSLGWSRRSMSEITQPMRTPIYADSLFYRLVSYHDWQYWYHAKPRHPGDRINYLTADLSVTTSTCDPFNRLEFLSGRRLGENPRHDHKNVHKDHTEVVD